MNPVEIQAPLKITPRPVERVLIDIPVDTLHSLQQIAGQRDMSVTALLKFYIGQGLRADLASQPLSGQ